MALRILIIHETRVTGKITQDYILMEFGDASVDKAGSAHEALEKLDRERYDIILCGMELSEMDGVAIHNHMLESGPNQDSSFILMTSSYEKVQPNQLAKRGIKYVLSIPFTPLQLRETIHEACDLRRRRVYPRYIIPQTRAIIRSENLVVPADVVNISMNGILCKQACPEQAAGLLKACHITVQFPMEYTGVLASNITSCMLRLTVESWRKDYSLEHIRAAWKFVDIPVAAQKVLETVLEKARRDLAATEAEAKMGIH